MTSENLFDQTSGTELTRPPRDRLPVSDIPGGNRARRHRLNAAFAGAGTVVRAGAGVNKGAPAIRARHLSALPDGAAGRLAGGAAARRTVVSTATGVTISRSKSGTPERRMISTRPAPIRMPPTCAAQGNGVVARDGQHEELHADPQGEHDPGRDIAAECGQRPSTQIFTSGCNIRSGRHDAGNRPGRTDQRRLGFGQEDAVQQGACYRA